MEAKILAISAAAFVGLLAVGGGLQTGLFGVADADESGSEASASITPVGDGSPSALSRSTATPVLNTGGGRYDDDYYHDDDRDDDDSDDRHGDGDRDDDRYEDDD
jgi:hypothetical protein